MRDDTSSGDLEELPLIGHQNDIMSIHAAAKNAVELAVSSLGDILFLFDGELYFYSSQLGYVSTDVRCTRTGHADLMSNSMRNLDITGLLRKASFSPNGSRIYGWSSTRNATVWENYWYLWNAKNAEQLSKVATPLKAVRLHTSICIFHIKLIFNSLNAVMARIRFSHSPPISPPLNDLTESM
jgi:hypothetical protein